MNNNFDVFISHTSKDKSAVRKIATVLANAGLKVWFDEWCILPGQAWQSVIKDAITNSNTLLIIIGNYGISPWQDYEMVAIFHNAIKEGRRIIPVFLPGAEKIELPLFLETIIGVQIKSFDEKDFQDALNKIIWGITGKIEILPKSTPTIPKVFLCHAKEDDSRIKNLYIRLREYDIDPWYDKEKLVVGDRWEKEIIEAIENTDFFAICLSQKSIKKTGFIQREIKLAVKEYQRRPQQLAFLLPVRLEPCEVPNIKLDEVTTLSEFHWIDLFEEEENSLKQFAEGVKKQYAKFKQDNQ